jgi:hypothetical protein
MAEGRAGKCRGRFTQIPQRHSVAARVSTFGIESNKTRGWLEWKPGDPEFKEYLSKGSDGDGSI